ncbi:uncharacterized protein LOC141679598 [Apium graveolens]|uniref:uncharacterized protein LOC141679598 n=1 Tax=Apium graveolens TaxID=4045 RepID=UPI003D7A3396
MVQIEELQLKKIHGRSRVAVTRSTGVAACAIRGQTLHSFAGVGLGDGDCQLLIDNIVGNRDAYRRWNKVKALVVDEISMIDAMFLDRLEYVTRELPLVNSKCLEVEECVFEAECWDQSFDVQFELTAVFRQSDAQLIKFLQEPDPSIARFFSRNDDVCKVNKNHLKSLSKEIYVFRALHEGAGKWKKQLKHVTAPDELEICIGARVMLTKNLDPQRKFVNGATVHGDWIIEPEEWVVMDGELGVARRKQMPLMLSWALSIHKCQGMTLDLIYTDLSHAFGYGMVYVALSRVRSLDGLHISGFTPSKIKAHRKVLQFYKRFKKEEDGIVRL